MIFFYISNEGVSLLENAGHLGLPIPQKMKDVLEQLHDRGKGVIGNEDCMGTVIKNRGRLVWVSVKRVLH